MSLLTCMRKGCREKGRANQHNVKINRLVTDSSTTYLHTIAFLVCTYHPCVCVLTDVPCYNRL